MPSKSSHWLWSALAWALITVSAHGQDGDPVDPQDAPSDPAATQDAADATGPVARPPDEPDVVVTATRTPRVALDTPFATSTIDLTDVRASGDGRSVPNALSREPGVLLQKTGPGQSSPYIRGFTGFRTLWMVDGIRLNNSTWRDGPNQYAGTIDIFSVDRLEIVKGPNSALYGSDAVGGTVQAITLPAAPWRYGGGRTASGLYEIRANSGERSVQQRVAGEAGREGEWGIKGGATWKDFGDIRSGDGRLPDTGYDERAFDARLDLYDGPDGTHWSFGAQSVRQNDVPRTHSTIASKSFHGTTIGSDLQRTLDQSRDLLWSRVDLPTGSGGLVDAASVTVSYQRQEESQDRVRTGGRFEERGFQVDTTGVQLQFANETDLGLFTWGFDAWHDEVDSHRRNVTVGSSPLTEAVQGSVADDSSYDLMGVYLQDEIVHGDFETIIGVRGTYARADANRIDNPNVPGSDPATPGNVIDAEESWSDLSASVRTLYHVSETASLWAGLSQGFRAPNLSDLTSDLEDSGVESPTPDLDEETFLSLEAGVKVEEDRWNGEFSVYRTWMDDTIVRSPTGAVNGSGTPVFRKDNAGDGWIHGLELRGERFVGDDWTVFGSVAWLDGEVDQFTPAGNRVSGPIDRLMPLTGLAGVTLDPVDTPWWVQADVLAADEADKLSLRDKADTQRIPPGGTPGWAVVGLRGGVDVNESLRLGLALENLLDKDYRIHGSGQNEPGRSLVFHARWRF